MLRRLSLIRCVVGTCLFLLISPVLAHVVTVPASPSEKSAGVTSEAIAANPMPNVTLVTVSDESVFHRAYRRVTGSFQIFNAGGALLEDRGKGFVYVTAGRGENGLSSIGGSQYVSAEMLSTNVRASEFKGFQFPDAALEYTPSWIVQKVRPSAHPGEAESATEPILERYTLVNLFTYVELDGYRWYQIGDNKWVHQYNVAKVVPVPRPADLETHKWVSVDLYEQVMIAYEGDKPVFATLISSGLPEWSTPEGLFYVYMRLERVAMVGAQGKPDFYYLQDVPWNMFFKDDVALHGTYWHDGFGYRHSHGCVNLSLADASWIYNWSVDESDATTPDDKGLGVYVYSSGSYK